MKLAAGFAFCTAAAWAQVVGMTAVPVQITINWPGSTVVTAKYGPVPKGVTFGEVVGCDLGATPITFGEGDVIQALRLQGFQALSIQDAISVVGNAQATSPRQKILKWTKSGIDSVVQAKATGALGGSNGAGVALVLGANIAAVALPNLSGALSLKQLITYTQDGMKSVMEIPAGRCTMPGSVLFVTTAGLPIGDKTSFQVTAYTPAK